MVFVSSNKDDQAILKIIVRPRAKRTTFTGLHDNMVRLSVTVPPVDGKANREVISYLAEFFGLKKKEIKIITGKNSRKKRCSIGRLKEQEVRQKVERFLQG